MKKLLILAGIALIAATTALPATASETASPRAKMMFWFLDRNSDGFIDAVEIEAFRTARFHSMDLDGDGKLTRAEATAAIESTRGRKGHDKTAGAKADIRRERQEKREAAMLKRLGFGNATEVTLVAFVGREPAMLKRADKNGDGRIDEAEFLAVRDGKGRHSTSD